jgi:hypothetical protein
MDEKTRSIFDVVVRRCGVTISNDVSPSSSKQRSTLEKKKKR